MKTDIEKAQALLDAAYASQRSANAALANATRVLNEAKSAAAPPHEWEGKKVRRFEQGVYTTKGRWVTGIVAVWRGSAPLYRQGGFRVDCGELYVHSLSGKTWYRWHSSRSKGPWELVQ